MLKGNNTKHRHHFSVLNSGPHIRVFISLFIAHLVQSLHRNELRFSLIVSRSIQWDSIIHSNCHHQFRHQRKQSLPIAILSFSSHRTATSIVEEEIFQRFQPSSGCIGTFQRCEHPSGIVPNRFRHLDHRSNLFLDQRVSHQCKPNSNRYLGGTTFTSLALCSDTSDKQGADQRFPDDALGSHSWMPSQSEVGDLNEPLSHRTIPPSTRFPVADLQAPSKRRPWWIQCVHKEILSFDAKQVQFQSNILPDQATSLTVTSDDIQGSLFSDSMFSLSLCAMQFSIWRLRALNERISDSCRRATVK